MDVVVYSVLKALIGRTLMGISDIKLDTTTNKHWIVTTTAGDTFRVAIPNSVNNPIFLNKLGWDDAENCLTYDGNPIKTDGGALTEKIVGNTACGASGVGTVFNIGLTLDDVVKKFVLKDEAPSVVLTLTCSDGQAYTVVRERGVSIDVTTKSVITKKSYDIKSISWLDGIVATETANANGGTYTKSKTGIADTFKVTSKAVDIKNLVGSNSKQIDFVDPIYVCYIEKPVDIADVTEDMIKAGTKELKKKGTITEDIIANNQKVGFAYPKSYGNLTSIKDVKNALENMDSFDIREINITTVDGTVVPYSLYLNSLAVTLTASDKFQYQLKW